MSTTPETETPNKIADNIFLISQIHASISVSAEDAIDCADAETTAETVSSGRPRQYNTICE